MLERVYVKDRAFMDRTGRTRIFHGVNLVCKDKSKGYVDKWNRFDFEELSRLGFNLIRLGIFWDGLEPEPNKYDDSYLSKIEALLDLCAEYGIYVLLDMHQDLYSVRYSDGAPEWATFTDGLPEPKKEFVWSDAYLSSEAVQRAFDHFWANSPAHDGVGLQDHFAECWRYVAQRFGSRTNVLGYDLLNEPFPGTIATLIFHKLLTTFSDIESKISGEPPKSLEEVVAMFFNEQGRLEALKLLDDKHLYKSFVSAAESYVAEFDTKVLVPFYERIAKAIRSVTSEGILFLENNYFSNIGIQSGLQPITIDNKREKLQAFAPHGYDLVVDTPFYEHAASENRVSIIFENHYAVQQRLNMPVVVGEWGGFGALRSENVLRHCLFLLDLFDSYGWSFTYWAWNWKESSNYATTMLLKRDYPKAIAGDLIYFKYDPVTSSFFMEWDADASIDTPTVICLPEGLRGRKIKISPQSMWNLEDVNGTLHLVIKATQSGRHTVILE